MNSTRRQPQRVPPPLLSGNERIEGQAILEEFSGDEALVLWKTYRAVALWSQMRPRQRRELFSSEAYQSRLALIAAARGLGEATDAVEALAELFRRTLQAPVVAARCSTIEEWADSGNAPRTAVEFAQLAALAIPADASAAARAGRRLRDLAEYARAESWYWEAIVRARKAGDWQAYVLSTLGLGITGYMKGNFPGARRSLERGLRRARRQGLTQQEAMAYHELAVLAMKVDNLPQAVTNGRAALRIYGPDHPRVPWLAHDIAVFWMGRGFFRAALDVLRAIPSETGTSSDHAARLAGIARAAGATGDLNLFSESAAELDRLLLEPATASRASSALLDTARGAVSLGLLESAREIAIRASALAESRGEGEIRLDADALMEEIRAADAARTAEAKRAPRRVLEFADELVRNLVTAVA